MSATPNDQDLISELSEGFTRTAANVVPWFLASMPEAYFRDTNKEQRHAHLRAIIAARADDRPLRLLVRSDTTWTFFRERDYPGLLAELLLSIPKDAALQSAKVYSAKDGTLVLDTFRFGEPPRFDPADAALAQKRAEVLEYASGQGLDDAAGRELLAQHFEASSLEYLRVATEFRIWRHYQLCQSVSGTDHTVVELDEDNQPGWLRVNIAAGNAKPPVIFERLCSYFGHHKYDIQRAYLDVFDATERGTTSVLGFVLADDGRLSGEQAGLAQLRRDLQRLRWLPREAIELAYAHPEHFTLASAEVAVAVSHLVHTRLARVDRHTFSRERLLAVLDRYAALVSSATALLADRFNPEAPLAEDSFTQRAEQLHSEIDADAQSSSDRRALHQFVQSIEQTLRTNLHLPQRYGLAMRLMPELLVDPDRAQPYGVFFVSGRGFDAFHVRFRDIARGGVRVVRPRGPEQYAVESRRIFDEAYDLAFAQQLKNKDIPEGGSKAVILTTPGRPVHPCVRAFADGILDLISPVVKDQIVDLFGKEELIYLGPDENIDPALIEWIAARAATRGYPLAAAFMSSKPGAGINHKEYGVTSEGVNVFLEAALRHIGVNPREQPFTLKMTGGPDGDVAGNELLILMREYGDNVRVVGIADGSGSAEDPDGLDHAELTRLVKAEAPIIQFNTERLGAHGKVFGIDDAGGVRRRDTLHNRVKADAFVPAGGRPATIRADNWRAYLDPDGVPSSRVIVEGANLFVTPEARVALSEAGVVVVKDSSANKCGVICSSFEICGSMLISAEELLAHKPRFVEEVLTKLRTLAGREAALLFRETKRQPERPLPELSVAVSRAIARVNDAVLDAHHTLEQTAPETVNRIVREHLPPLLVELAGEHLDRLPEAYRAGIVGASLATRLVYREGLSFVQELPQAELGRLAFAYLHAEDRCAALAEAIRKAELPEGDEIAHLLLEGGPRIALS